MWLAVLMGAACGGAPRTPAAADAPESRPLVDLPTEAQMLAASPETASALAPFLNPSVRAVSEWQIEAAPQPPDLPYAAEGPFEAMLDQAARQRGVRLHRSGSLRCAAQEVGRYLLRSSSPPPPRFVRAIANACGTSLDRVRVSGAPGAVGAGLPLADLVRQASASMTGMLADALVDGELVGLAFAREGDQAVLVMVHGLPRMQVEALSPPDADGWVSVRGRLLFTNVERVRAFVNQGASGVAPCRVADVALPEFEVRCPMADGDAHALLEIRGAVLSQGVSRLAGTLMLRRSLEVAPPVVLPSLGAPLPVTDAESAAPQIVARVNALRADAGLPPLTLATAQSELNARVAPSLLLSSQQDIARSELITKGLFAGRRVVGGDIRTSYAAGEVSEGSRDASRWLAARLETPNGRRALMDPDARQLAIGAVPVPDREALAVVLSTYSFFDDSRHAAEADALFERIAAARVAAGLPAPQRLQDVSYLRAQVGAVCDGSVSPLHAVRAARGAARDEGSSVRVRVFESADLATGALPDAALAPGPLQLGVAVAHTRAPGAAWGQYAVFLALR